MSNTNKDFRMPGVRKTEVKVNGKRGVILHNRLLADGPIDPETGKTLLDPKTGEEMMGPNDDMGMLIHEYLVKLRSPITLAKTSETVPRFGVLSLVAMNTPIYVYDHPAFKEVTNTAFTDGNAVFIDADFMRKMVEQEYDTDGRESGVMFVLLHELMHKMLYHVDRMRNFPRDIANKAQDLVINGKLVKGFPSVRPIKMLMEMSFGVKSEEAEKYYSMAEEVVAEMLLVQERKKKAQQQAGGSGNDQSSGGSKGGSGSQGSSKSNSSGKQEKNSSGSGKKQGGGSGAGSGEGGEDKESGDEYDTTHHITPEELLDIIEREGLHDTVGKALDLPRRDDADGLARIKERSKMNTIDAIQTALSQSSQCGGEYPGAHIAESAAEVIGGLDKGKMTWKLGITKHVMGSGQKMRHTDNEVAMPWHFTKEDTGLDPWYEGTLIPHAPDETVVALVDTSGSTGGGTMRRDFLNELLGLKKRTTSGLGDTARKVIMFSADTVLRGEPLVITEGNVESLRHDGVPIFGNGGTDFKRCLDEVLALPMMRKEKVKSVIYFTDCCDHPPSREDFEVHLKKGIKIVFVTTPDMWNEKWNADVGGWAEVYCIEKGTVVDLESKTVNRDTRKNNPLS